MIKPGLLGHEWDEDLDNGFRSVLKITDPSTILTFRPPGLVRLSRTTVNNLWMVQVKFFLIFSPFPPPGLHHKL